MHVAPDAVRENECALLVAPPLHLGLKVYGL
jgi:hypothetical protein